jgi:hypothetical protein
MVWQAGAHFALDILGMWWSGTAREKWPEGGQDSSGLSFLSLYLSLILSLPFSLSFSLSLSLSL